MKNKVLKRIYNNFFRPSYESVYELILRIAKEKHYEFHTIHSFEEVIKKGINAEKKYLIIRRDVDTADISILRKMLELEIKYSARASYYFRWNTMNIKFMEEISRNGGEASYHYEEIATYCYQNRCRSCEQVLDNIEEIRDAFIANIEKFRNVTNLPCHTVASHGDYVNTKLQLQNYVLIDERVRNATKIIREAYDKAHFELLTCRIADQSCEMEDFKNSVIDAMNRNEQVIEILTHPRQWSSPFWINLKEEINRVMKWIYMGL